MEFLFAFFSLNQIWPSSYCFHFKRGQKVPTPKKITFFLIFKSDLIVLFAAFFPFNSFEIFLLGVMVFNATFNNISAIS